MRNLIALPLMIAALAGCAATPAELARSEARTADAVADLNTALAGYAPDGTSSCAAQSRNSNSTVYGKTILFRPSPGSVIYRTDTAGGCERAANGAATLVTRTTSASLCRGDIVQVFDRVAQFPIGSCSLGEFTTYRRIRK